MAVTLGVAATAALGASNRKTETDIKLRVLPKEIGKAFCEGDFSLKTFWNYGVYDAQVEGFALASLKYGSTVSEQDAATRALELARSTNKKGYASGLCANGSAWAVALPVATALTLNQGELNASGANVCGGRLDVLWSAAERGRARRILSDKKPFHYRLPQEQDGFVSVVCNDKLQGPLEFYLAPTGKAKIETPLAWPAKNAIKRPDEMVVDWINALRARDKLVPLKFSSEILQVMGSFSQDPSIQHNLQKLRLAGQNLKTKSIRLIGEDKSRAQTIEEAVTLLWVSPSHRDLLLDPNASLIGVVVEPSDTRDLSLVIWVADRRKI